MPNPYQPPSHLPPTSNTSTTPIIFSTTNTSHSIRNLLSLLIYADRLASVLPLYLHLESRPWLSPFIDQRPLQIPFALSPNSLPATPAPKEWVVGGKPWGWLANKWHFSLFLLSANQLYPRFLRLCSHLLPPSQFLSFTLPSCLPYTKNPTSNCTYPSLGHFLSYDVFFEKKVFTVFTFSFFFCFICFYCYDFFRSSFFIILCIFLQCICPFTIRFQFNFFFVVFSFLLS